MGKKGSGIFSTENDPVFVFFMLVGYVLFLVTAGILLGYAIGNTLKPESVTITGIVQEASGTQSEEIDVIVLKVLGSDSDKIPNGSTIAIGISDEQLRISPTGSQVVAECEVTEQDQYIRLDMCRRLHAVISEE